LLFAQFADRMPDCFLLNAATDPTGSVGKTKGEGKNA
jgi:hypothetical protein